MDLKHDYSSIFTPEILNNLFPAHLTDAFFEALFGDSKEGAYDIRLAYSGHRSDQLIFELQLHQRNKRCLACNLTYGLPTVFSRHPIINLKGLVAEIEKILGGKARVTRWSLGRTQEVSKALHTIPLQIHIEA